MDWFEIGVLLAVVTAVAMAFGFWLVERRPRMHAPVLFVGFFWGLVVGGIMWVAFRLSGDRPEQHVPIKAIAVVLGAGTMLLASYWTFGPSLGLGATLGSGWIERPVAGFALTFPDDWTVSEATTETYEALFGSPEPAARAMQKTLLYADHELSDGYCVVVGFKDLADLAPAWTHVDEATTGFGYSYTQDAGFVGTTTEYLDLPAGRTGHISTTDDDGWARDSYYFTDSGAWFYIDCLASDAPVDHWRSIADTFEFLPPWVRWLSAGPSESVGVDAEADGADGLSLIFPEGWTVQDATPEDHPWLFSEEDDEFLRWRGVLIAVGDESICWVIDASGVADELLFWEMGDAVEWEMDGFADEPAYPGLPYLAADLAPSNSTAVTGTIVNLPAGRTGAIAITDAAGWSGQLYVFSSEARWLYLNCWSKDPPGDRWRSIAQTVELLPALG